MTEQSPNTQFHASSFLQGANADYIDQLAARYASDPASVDAQWADFFRSLGETELDTKRQAAGPSWARSGCRSLTARRQVRSSVSRLQPGCSPSRAKSER